MKPVSGAALAAGSGGTAKSREIRMANNTNTVTPDAKARSVEYFRWRIVPATLVAFFGLLILYGTLNQLAYIFWIAPSRGITVDDRLITFTLKKTTCSGLLSVFCFVIAACVMLRRWRTTAFVSLLAYIAFRAGEAAWNGQW